MIGNIYIDRCAFKNIFLNISITFIDKADPSDPEKRENNWIETLKTMVPWGFEPCLL